MPGPFNPELLKPVPRCDEKHPGARTPDGRRARSACPKCIRWDKHRRAVRRQELRDGVRKVKPRLDMVKPIVKATRCRQHPSVFVKGCPGCQAWNRYQLALRRQEEREGTLQRTVSPDLVAAHLRSLTNTETGGWFLREVAKESGVGERALGQILHGQRDTVLADTWNAVRVLKPKGKPRPPAVLSVDATEVRRIAQGLAAQGWSFHHMAGLAGKQTRHSMARLAQESCVRVAPETVDDMRALRDKLGDYDIASLPGPLPGMYDKCAAMARKKGWLPLSAWKRRNIADPDALPATVLHLVEDDHDDETGDTGLVPFVDPELLRLVRENAERLDCARPDEGRPADDCRDDQPPVVWVDPIGQVTWIEKYAAVAYGTQLGMSLAELGALLGYPQRTPREVGNSQRIASRTRYAVTAARTWIDSDPAGEIPPWWRLAEKSREFHLRVPALLAMLPAPVGPGWDVAELAKRCGVTEDEMRAFITAALPRAYRPWQPQVVSPATRAA